MHAEVDQHTHLQASTHIAHLSGVFCRPSSLNSICPPPFMTPIAIEATSGAAPLNLSRGAYKRMRAILRITVKMKTEASVTERKYVARAR